MKLFEMFSEEQTQEAYTRPKTVLHKELIVYPNATFDRGQALRLPVGTEVGFAPGGNLEVNNIAKIIADNKVWFAWRDDYYNAIGSKQVKEGIYTHDTQKKCPTCDGEGFLENGKSIREAGIGKAVKKGLKNIKRGMQGWDKNFSTPDKMVAKHQEYDTDTLKDLGAFHNQMQNGDALDHSPRGLQQKLIKRNLRKRGERDFEKYMDEDENPNDWSEAKQETIMRLRDAGGEIYDKAKLVKGDEEAILARNGNVRFVIFQDGTYKRAKNFIDFQKDGWELEMNLGEETGEFVNDEPDNINYKLLAQKIENAVQMSFPDADPLDQLMKYEDQLERNGTSLMDALNKAAKDFLGAKDYNDFLANFWDEYAGDNPESEGGNPWRESIGESKSKYDAATSCPQCGSDLEQGYRATTPVKRCKKCGWEVKGQVKEARTREAKQNWFETLNAALESEGLLNTWEMSMSPIGYGENRSWNAVDDQGQCQHISIYRETDGRYERPVHYPSKMC